MVKLMGFFVKVDDNRVKLDVNTQIEIVFKSLTKELASFRALTTWGTTHLP
ncbi:hypothetical protein Golax_025793 [Gossypium laxum]|uniref:Uncharacterized protein n=1 Tax=Gossypium laxum TaxID=34288 RepID=A0A7J9B179_9ROSI|nr:hypothetical protein [Gossypium laxum]